MAFPWQTGMASAQAYNAPQAPAPASSFNFGSIIGDLGGIIAQSRGRRDINQEIPILQSMIDAAEASRVYAQAAADPSSKFFVNLAGMEEERLRRDFMSNLRQILVSHRRARARGAPGFGINPERRDESRYRAIITFFEEAKDKARQLARQMLLQASQASAGAAGSFGPAVNAFGTYGGYEANRQAGLGEAIGSLGAKLGPQIGEMFTPSQSAPQPEINLTLPGANWGNTISGAYSNRTSPFRQIYYGS